MGAELHTGDSITAEFLRVHGELGRAHLRDPAKLHEGCAEDNLDAKWIEYVVVVHHDVEEFCQLFGTFVVASEDAEPHVRPDALPDDHGHKQEIDGAEEKFPGVAFNNAKLSEDFLHLCRALKEIYLDKDKYDEADVPNDHRCPDIL